MKIQTTDSVPAERLGLHSMTGYGRGQAVVGGLSVTAEMSSVNRRQLDIRLHLPRVLALREPLFLQLIKRRLSRGHLTASVTVDSQAGQEQPAVNLSSAMLNAWILALRETAAKAGLKDDLKASHLLNLPGLLPDVPDRLTPQAERVALQAFESALEGLCSMRRQEGTKLQADLANRLGLLRKSLEIIAAQAPCAAMAARELLQRRLAEAGENAALEDEAFRRELIFFAGRSDVTEEIIRLRSHFDQAENFLRSSEPTGRSLEFLAQEMAREINTIGAKAADVRISREVVVFKTELERFREQAQNVE